MRTENRASSLSYAWFVTRKPFVCFVWVSFGFLFVFDCWLVLFGFLLDTPGRTCWTALVHALFRLPNAYRTLHNSSNGTNTVLRPGESREGKGRKKNPCYLEMCRTKFLKVRLECPYLRLYFLGRKAVKEPPKRDIVNAFANLFNQHNKVRRPGESHRGAGRKKK